MKNFYSAVWAEVLKIRRSKMLWITVLAFVFIPFMMGVLMFVTKHPETAQKFGLMGSKAAMLRFGDADWSTYFALIIQAMTGIGLLGFGVITGWIFGREYSDRTAKDLLALPIPRSYVVLSKFIVVTIWCILLSVTFWGAGLVIGKIIQFSGWSGAIVFHHAYIFFMTTLLTILLVTPVAFFASFGRGYLPPIGFVLLTLILVNFVGLIGIGPYFPWAIPGIYSDASAATGNESAPLGTISYSILFLTSIVGLIGTLAWWRYADQ